MLKLRKLLDKARSDEGMSLVEVIVALTVFAVIALGVGYSTITILKMTEDTRSRQVATNLATSEIDKARGYDDPFDIVNGTSTTTVGKRTYTIVRSTSWVETSGADVGCGTGTGTLQSKRVNVTVTWDGMLNTTPAVRSDTLISPDERINDPSLGTIRISVLNALGTGSSGVAVTITPNGSGVALTKQPDATNTDGCSFALKVAPGTYSVAISRANSVDSDQVANPSKSVVVTAGSSVAAPFQYDYASTFTLNYASNVTSSPKLPEDLDTTYLSTYGLDYSTGRASQVALHPISSGYAGMAGKYVAATSGSGGCLSVDPAAWRAATVNSVPLAAGERTDPVAALPKGTATMDIPMGTATVKHTTSAYLFAVSATAPAAAADPGCSISTTYSFGKVLTNGTITVALPYGSWILYSGSQASGSGKTAIAPANVGLIGSVLNLVGSILPGAGSVITLDPRAKK